MTRDERIRSIHGVAYTRLYDADILDVVIDEADDFNPPPVGLNGGTGLYAGEQDMFAFLVDNHSWVDIGGEQFAPGFFVWNSEVGRRTVGIETFWYQRVCANHIVWDATEVVSYSRKHTANVLEAVDDMATVCNHGGFDNDGAEVAKCNHTVDHRNSAGMPLGSWIEVEVGNSIRN